MAVLIHTAVIDEIEEQPDGKGWLVTLFCGGESQTRLLAYPKANGEGGYVVTYAEDGQPVPYNAGSIVSLVEAEVNKFRNGEH